MNRRKFGSHDSDLLEILVAYHLWSLVILVAVTYTRSSKLHFHAADTDSESMATTTVIVLYSSLMISLRTIR